MSRAAEAVPVLVLDAQTNQALACVRSLGAAGHPVLVASTRRRPLGGWSVFARARYRLAGETTEAFGGLRTWAVEHGVRCVLPLTERACLLCNADRKAWEAAGVVVGCGSETMLLQAFDKAATLRVAEGSGVRVPATRMPESWDEFRAAADELGFPCVIKPRFSNAWDGTRFLPDVGPAYVARTGELAAAVRAGRQGERWPLIQEYTRGRGRGVFALFDHEEPVAWFAHERLRDVRPSGSGSSLRRSIPLPARLQAPAERLLRALQWHGPAMVEFRDDDEGEPCLVEVNGRFWGSLQLAIDAGVDFPRLWLAILTGEPVARVEEYDTTRVSRWLWGDVKRFGLILAGTPSGYPGVYPTRWQGVRELFGRQPRGTRIETWDRRDPWPGVGEWLQGVGELARQGFGGRRKTGVVAPAPEADHDLR